MTQADTSAFSLSPDEHLTVVVIPLIGGAQLKACLAVLRGQPAKEILVVAQEVFDPPAKVRFILAPTNSNVPVRRMIGLGAGATPVVAFLEDTCMPGVGWSSALCAAFAAPDVLASGGPISISASLTPQIKALAIGEYGRFFRAPKSAPTDVDALAGANFALRRETFVSASFSNGLIDNAVFDAVRKARGRIVFQPQADVTYVVGPPKQARLSTRFHHGRIYGGLQTAQRPLAVRMLLALAALAAPVVLLGRNLRDAGPQLLRSPSTLAWVTLMHCAWGCGEVLGKLTGSVGTSFKRWA